MNMSTQHSPTVTHNLSNFIEEQMVACTNQTDRSANAKVFLDNNFPLTNGSHADVSSYVIYYTHLLAFMEDGSQCGLQNPCQFVALTGHKSDPTSVVLKNNDTHVEICFDRNGNIGQTDAANIDDIQVALPIKNLPTPYKHWVSLLQTNRVPTKGNGKAFTAKDGSDYAINQSHK
ncbi:malate synthase [Shewanella intestini]|uniref:Malate synthase n=1 Tax=Shewanella intestini TaxID=2017544 RepID=A0ABS5I5J9_9GAMM|nr:MULTISPECIES: malate synthase [Shewanella]MBR9729108.1 malate synthase [Shewanella intestini]